MKLIISNAFIKTENQLILHPSLSEWEKQLKGYHQQWFVCEDKVPLSWLAAMMDVAPADLLGAQLESFKVEEYQQYWVASPYHAQLGRDHYRVLPDAVFSWSADDANDLCELLNPLLQSDGMVLKSVGAALILLCRDAFDAKPMPFAQVSASLLPNRHPDGADGGRLMRLLSEIQMILHQSPSDSRRNRGHPDTHGVWLWGASTNRSVKPFKQPSIATKDTFLQAVVDGQEAKLTITDVENLAELVQSTMPLPKFVVLSGEGHAVLLRKSMLPRFRRASWRPTSKKSERELLSVLNLQALSETA